MSGKYQAYEEYKYSGVEWLGKIPEHWSRLKFKFIVNQGKIFASGPFGSSIGSQYYRDNGVPVIRGNNLSLNGDKPKYVDDGYVFLEEAKADDLSNAEVIPGDLVFTARGTVGQVGLVPTDGTINWKRAILSANQLRFRNKNINLSSSYLWYLFSSWLIRTQIDLSSDSVAQPNLNLGSLKDLQLLCPGFSEQDKIANFLDHETAKIDTLIEKQQQLIKLLKEKRQAVISHAVTKGLNTNAPMRDSGVEWLGEVPEHWKVSSLGYYSEVSTGATPDRSKPQYWGGSISWIKTGEVKYDEILETEEYITLDGVANSAVTISPPGTLLMAMYGQGVTRGRVALLGISATYNQACAAISSNEKLWNQYLRYFFMAAYHAIRDGGNETSQMNLNADIVSKFKITIPDLYEQRNIVRYLNTELNCFDRLIDKAVDAIELIQERRTALISAAVTGKIDVRNWQAPNKENKGVKA